MTPTEQLLLEALRPFAGPEVPHNPNTLPASSFAQARKLVEKLDGDGENEFRTKAPLVGADPDWYGQTFKHGRKFLTVVGVNPTKPKNAMSVRDTDGRVYGCPVSMVRNLLPTFTPPPRQRTRNTDV